MVNESRLIELLEGGASLAVCAVEFDVSRNAIHKRKTKLIAAGKLKADEAAEPEDSGLSDLERKAVNAQDEFQAARKAHEYAQSRRSTLPHKIEDAKKALAEAGAAFCMGELTDVELDAAEMELEGLKKELQTVELAVLVLEKRQEELRGASEQASRAALEAAKERPFQEMKARFLERGTPLNSGEEQEIRRLAGAGKRYEVDDLIKSLEDMTGRRMLQTGHAMPREQH